MSRSTLLFKPASRLTERRAGAGEQPLGVPAGRLVELSGVGAVARTTTAVELVRQAQVEGEPCAWIQSEAGSLFPPDLRANGIDLDALVVVLVPRSAGGYGLPKAAEMLLRSSAFGMVVVDLRDVVLSGDAAWQSRIQAVAREHNSRVVLLTSSHTHKHSLGPLVSLRIEPRRQRFERGVFAIEPVVLKDKSGWLGDVSVEHFRGPSGLW